MKFEVLQEVLKTKDSKFCSFVYTNQQGEKSKYLVHLNVNIKKIYERDIKFLESYLPSNDIERLAHAELLSSMRTSIETNFNNPNYTKAGYYETMTKAVKFHEDTIYIHGFVISKVTIERGEYKTVNSSAKTIAKNGIRKLLKSSKIREFKLNANQLEIAKLNGKTIELN